MIGAESARLRALAALSAATLTAAPSSQVFRATTEVVLVDVLVRQANAPVRGLSLADFELFDEGLPQQIDDVRQEQMPIDLTVLLDSSGSTSDMIDRFRIEARQIVAMLRPEDRVRLMAFGTEVRELAPFQQGGGALRFAEPMPGGGTSLNDALVLAMARRGHAGRRHLAVGFTDGIDTTSVLDSAAVNQAARSADSVIHLVVSTGRPGPAVPLPAHLLVLREAARATGGGLASLSGDPVDTLRRVFTDFRESYVLRYTPRGVLPGGWHRISVRIRRPDADRYTVRARTGYFAG